MIDYDLVLEGLPERVRELTVRLRDIVLSLGPGITEKVRKDGLEYTFHQRFAALLPDRTGVALSFAGPFKPALGDPESRISVEGRDAVLRLASASDIDDVLRRICREAYARAQTRTAKPRETGLDATSPLAEALQNVSRGLRLLIHHQQAMEKAALLKARSQERLGQKRSHKKKPPPVPPPLVIGGPELEAPPAPSRRAKPAARKPMKRKPVKQKPAAKKRAPVRKKPVAKRTKAKKKARR